MISPSPRPLWGWSLPARGLLILLAAAGAIGMLATSRTADGPHVPVPQLVVDPNTAPPEVLIALPRLGPVLVRAIIEAREEAPFQSLEDLDARVKRVGPATVAAIRPYLRIEPHQHTPPPPPASGLAHKSP
jgi:DNA uptake protein ComE-like DNA-binding protein